MNFKFSLFFSALVSLKLLRIFVKYTALNNSQSNKVKSTAITAPDNTFSWLRLITISSGRTNINYPCITHSLNIYILNQMRAYFFWKDMFYAVEINVCRESFIYIRLTLKPFFQKKSKELQYKSPSRNSFA